MVEESYIFLKLYKMIIEEKQGVYYRKQKELSLFLNGQSMEMFSSDRYTLEVQKILILNKIINLPTGGASVFCCEKYFINKVERMVVLDSLINKS